jgi:hypothetical protein
MSNPLTVGVIWESYTPKLEARLMMDAMKIASEANGVPFEILIHESLPVETAALAIKMLARINISAAHRNVPSGEDYSAVLQYTDTGPVDLPLDMYAPVIIPTILNPPPRNDVGPEAVTDPDPYRPPYTGNDPYPGYRTHIPQGVPSLLALPPWAFIKPASSP